MEEKLSTVYLKVDEKARISAEYITPLIHVFTVNEKGHFETNEDIWSQLFSSKDYHENCLNINDFVLRFLTQTFNECSIEIQVSVIESIKTSSRPLKHQTAEKVKFITSNGPHPLLSLKVIKKVLNLHFNVKERHFSLTDKKHYTSKVVDGLYREAEMSNEFFDSILQV